MAYNIIYIFDNNYGSLTKYNYSEILASVVSCQHASRYVPQNALARVSRQKTRDHDGNILSDEIFDLHHYRYPTDDIPSTQLENLIRAISIDEIQAVILYH